MDASRSDEWIWGAAEKLRNGERPEVRRRMLEWFGHKVVWGGVDKGNGAVEEGSIPVTHGDSILIHRDSTIQEQLKSRFESRQGSGLEMAVVVLYIPVQDVEPGQRPAYKSTERQQMAIDDV